ncbi:MAG: 16S rRNA (guanine(527)-N(7))-methyltransferase RsmG [Minwuia sp.]|uniref:16S rRNA (guanine(527)-N(7))-methyltransferase RsmG n=1 Tax=Minwuia sp. TaxID=2493630 RepID=UPI003A8BA842
MDRSAFAEATGVSRETLERLDIYAAELRRWNRAINLVAPKSLDDLWRRHFLDSWQLLDLAGPGPTPWTDLGSGGGFPGLVLAACGVRDLTLVESDQRKSVFLRETARRMEVTVDVRTERIETASLTPARTISARALAPLNRLCELAAPFAMEGGVLLFPKGQDVDRELTEATKYWKFELTRTQSLSDPRGVVLTLRKLERHD